MNDGGGWKTAALAYAERVRGVLKGFTSANPFFGGVIRSGGAGRGGRGSGSNPFFGGRGEVYDDPYAVSVGSVPGGRPGRRWSGSAALRRGAAGAGQKASPVVFRIGARTLRQSLGAATSLLPSSAVARLKVRTIKGMSGSMSGLPGITVATHNGVRNNNGPKKG